MEPFRSEVGERVRKLQKQETGLLARRAQEEGLETDPELSEIQEELDELCFWLGEWVRLEDAVKHVGAPRFITTLHKGFDELDRVDGVTPCTPTYRAAVESIKAGNLAFEPDENTYCGPPVEFLRWARENECELARCLEPHLKFLALSEVAIGDEQPQAAPPLTCEEVTTLLKDLEAAQDTQSEVLVGRSQAIEDVRTELLQFAIFVRSYDPEKRRRPPSPLLLLGETGVGKETCVDFLCECLSERKEKRVNCNCAHFETAQSARSELFGHVKGAFTGAISPREGLVKQAQGGILFLDEIGDLHIEVQPLLNRFLDNGTIEPLGYDREERIVDVLVVAATNRHLPDRESFREDLYHRVARHKLTILPLRERREDIPTLIQHFLRQMASSLGVPGLDVSKNLGLNALTRLVNDDWPGNARELGGVLEGLVKRCLLDDSKYCIEVKDLPAAISHRPSSAKWEIPKTAGDFEKMFAAFPKATNWQDLGRQARLNGNTLNAYYLRLPEDERPQIPWRR